MEYKFDCWNGYQSLNVKHLTMHKGLNLNASKTFINVRQLPNNPNLKWNSSDSQWQLYMNHLDVFLPRMFTCWDNYSRNWWVGNTNGFLPSAGSDGEKFSDFSKGCKAMNIIPIYCIGASEEEVVGDWLGRSPTKDKWQWLGRFCKEFAIFINKKYGFKKAVLEIWNEPIECFGLYDVKWYSYLAAYMAKGWKTAGLGEGYCVWINSNDISHQDYISQLLNFQNLVMYTDAVATHVAANDRDDEWTYRENGASYIQKVNLMLHTKPLCLKYGLKKQILSEMSPVSGLNPYNDLDRASAQLKMFKERFEYIKPKVSGYGMLFIFVNNIVHTGNRDELIVSRLYNEGTQKSGTVIGTAGTKYNYLKSYNLS